MDLQLLKVVAEDLDYLSKEWNQEIDDASMRRSSPAIRSLLVEGQLFRAAREAGWQHKLRIMAPLLAKETTAESIRGTDYYQEGGAKRRGMQVSGLSIVRGARSAADIKAAAQNRGIAEKSYPVKVSVYLRQISFGIGGVAINREDVIKYVANKLGGAHYDPSRGKQSDPLEEKFRLLDSVHAGGLQVAEKDAVYYELLSIGQRVVNSRDIQKFRSELVRILENPRVIHL